MKAIGSMAALGISGVICGVMQWPHVLLNSQTQCIILLNIENGFSSPYSFFHDCLCLVVTSVNDFSW